MKRLMVLFGIAAVATTAIVALLIHGHQPTDTGISAAVPSTRDQVLAGQCIRWTKERLHDPGSAQLPSANSPFDFPSKFSISEKGALLTISFELRARNAFNALRAGVATCELRRSPAGDYVLSKHNIRGL